MPNMVVLPLPCLYVKEVQTPIVWVVFTLNKLLIAVSSLNSGPLLRQA